MRNVSFLKLLCGFITCLLYISCDSSIELTEEEQAWLTSTDSITVSVFPYYAPYQFKNKYGEIDGIFVDYLELIEKQIDYEFVRKEYSYWPNVIKDAKSGVLDVVLEIQKTSSREPYLQFYDLFFESPQSLVTLKSDITGSKLTDYFNKKITLPEGYAINETLLNKYPNLKIITEANDSICLTKLNLGLYDAYIGPRAVVNYFKESERLNNIKIVGNLPYNYAPDIAVQKHNKILNSIFKKATKSITRAQRLKIQDSWLFSEFKPFYKTVNFWRNIVIVVSVSLLLIILFNRYLKYLVNKRTKELRLSQEMAVKSNKLRTQFIKNISHEIRTPLNAILGFSTLLKMGAPVETENYITNIKVGTQSLKKILGDITQISELQTQKIDIKNEVVNIGELIEEVIDKFQNKAQKNDIILKSLTAGTSNSDFLFIDKKMTFKALSLLIETAINNTEDGIIIISHILKKSHAVIKIQGTDIGLNLFNTESQFESFTELQEKISLKQHSLGLGLTIAREHIVLLNGTIDYVSNKDNSSMFIIKLPYTNS